MIFLVILFVILIYYYKSKRQLNNSIPFVKEEYYPLIGHLFLLINNRTNKLKRCCEIYGENFQIKLFNQRIIFLLNPSDWTNIIRNQSFQFMGETFSKTIFDMDHNFFGKSHLDIQLQKYFNQYLINYEQLDQLNYQFIKQTLLFFQQEKNEFNDQWIKSNLFEFSWNLLFYSITKTLFGDIQLDQIKQNYRIFDSNIQFFFLLLPRWIYSLIFVNVLKYRNNLNKYWLNKIHENNQSQFIRDRTNLIINNSDWFSSKDYQGEKTFLLWSSLSNTIPTLFWSLFHILHDQNIFQIVKKEINENLSISSLNNFDQQLNNSKLKCFIYLDSIINECLRLYSNPMIMRKASKNIQLNLNNGKQILIQEKDIISFYPQIAQTNSKYFSNPNKFIFDRFINKTGENLNGFLPFGSGKSMCPGRLFAKNTIKISIILFLHFIHFDFNHFKIIPIENKQRQGIGVSHPQNDIQFLYKYK